MTEEERKKKFLEFFEKHQKVKSEGYAGILPNGNLVDRREFPNAIPLQYNPTLNIPHPKNIKINESVNDDKLTNDKQNN